MSDNKSIKILSGNIGEWSELYAFLRILEERKLDAADENLNRLKLSYPVIKIIRENKDYYTGEEIRIAEDGVEDYSVRSSETKNWADNLLEVLLTSAGGKIQYPEIQSFLNRIKVSTLKAPSSDKSDIVIKIHDVNSPIDPIVGFSIKSHIGGAPTLFNASGATNCIYEVEGIKDTEIDSINAINTKSKIRDRITAIINAGGQLKYSDYKSDTFKRNLVIIDSNMPAIISEMLLKYYSTSYKNCSDILKATSSDDILGYKDSTIYEYKFKKFLCAVALGMMPATPWNGIDEASGGCIIVKESGDIVVYHVYNRNDFEGYLYTNTRFESPSTSRHDYAVLYKKDEKLYMNLNLQIRFIK